MRFPGNWRRSILLWPLTLCVATLSNSARAQTPSASELAADHDQDYAELRRVPEKARIRHSPFEHDEQAVAAGKKLFGQHCAECHGSKAEGSKRAPSLRADEIRQATSGTLFWLLTNGVVRRGMPVWSKLPEPERWQIVSYVESLQTAAVETPR